MHLHLILQALFAITAISVPLAAPEIAEDDPDIVVPKPEDIAGFGYSTIRFKCYPDPPPPHARLNYNECNSSLVEFKERYPPAQKGELKYTLTHREPDPSVPRSIHCPVIINADPQPFGCSAAFDYKTYPYDQDFTDRLSDINELGEAIINTCVSKQRYFGGRVHASYGSQSLDLSLEYNMQGTTAGGSSSPSIPESA